MTLQEARSLCTDPFEPMFLWTVVEPVKDIDVDGHAYWLQWIMVDPYTMKRIYIYTPGPVTDLGSLQQYVQRNACTLHESSWAILRGDNPLYGVNDWCAGTCQKCADWLMTKLNTKRSIGS